MPRTLGLLVCCLLVGRVARAQESGQDPRVAEAKVACVAGDYQKGVRLLAEIYIATNDPIWIFNQGRCYHQNAQPALALSRFREFLRKNQGAPGEDLRDAQNYIAEIEAELQRVQPAQTSTAPPVEPAVVVASDATLPAAKPGRGLRYAGVTAFVVGGLAVVSGVTFTLLMHRASNDIEAQTSGKDANWSDVSGKYADGNRYQTLQWVGYWVGAAALITGTVLYWMGAASAEPKQSAARAFPLFMANGAGAGLHVAF